MIACVFFYGCFTQTFLIYEPVAEIADDRLILVHVPTHSTNIAMLGYIFAKEQARLALNQINNTLVLWQLHHVCEFITYLMYVNKVLKLQISTVCTYQKQTDTCIQICSTHLYDNYSSIPCRDKFLWSVWILRVKNIPHQLSRSKKYVISISFCQYIFKFFNKKVICYYFIQCSL